MHEPTPDWLRRFRPCASRFLILVLLAAALIPGCGDENGGGGKTEPRAIYIPGTYDTVEEALAAVLPGDSVFVELVAFEIFTAPIVVESRQTPFYLAGTKARPQLIAPSDAAPLIRLIHPKPGTTFRNIAFAGGNPAVSVEGGTAAFVSCRFTGGVVHVRASADADSVGLEDNLFVGPSLFAVQAGGTARVVAERNTIVRAGDCGVLIADAAVGRLRQNLVARSTNFGIACTGSGALDAASGCNNIFRVGRDFYLGCDPPPSDLRLDPLFCDELSGDYSVGVFSPCAPVNSGGCGRIGAFGVGCDPGPLPP